jgi:hypothetical protein
LAKIAKSIFTCANVSKSKAKIFAGVENAFYLPLANFLPLGKK